MREVVKLVYPEPSIAHVIMEDRVSKNTFSPDLTQGLMVTFEKIKNISQTKVVVIQGFDNYFCCGGTKEELSKIFVGEMTFIDLPLYKLLLDCELPVIAAMQGHAVGGGLAFGCYADFIVMGEECAYTANFMKYGFTPGMGATYMVPKKLGDMLGNEMLFSARNYYGSELKQRGVSAQVVKKQAVVDTAMALAQTISEKTVIALKMLKQHLTERVKLELPVVIEKELAMHAVTFKQPEVKARIESLFGS